MPSDLPHFNPETPLSAKDSLQISSIKLGKLELRDVVVNSRQAGIQLYEILQLTIQQIENSRRRRNSTRFPDTLPIASPSRRLSEEVADYLADMTRRALQDTTIKAAARSLKILQMTCGDIPVSM
ncbi:TPA: integrase, partial [Stenotrophomonas maltophilia]